MIKKHYSDGQHGHRQRGFTMIEMIGVLAVIAILASIVAPKIFDAIRDSKVNTFAANIQAVQTAVTSYYKDVGVFPTGAQLISDTATGWKGPYLDKKVADMFSSLPLTSVALSSEAISATANFDIDGNATAVGDYSAKTTMSQLSFVGMAVADAKAVSGAIDGDDAKTGDAAGNKWYNMGRFVADTYTLATEPVGSANYRAFVGAI
ncbi:MAG: prepilin-type N-terminal cleavage/methylation domain-containing protein [Mariprofundales bacterium]